MKKIKIIGGFNHEKKVCTILTAVALFVSGSMTAYAADASHVPTEASDNLTAEASLAESVTKSFFGMSYDTGRDAILGLHCACTISPAGSKSGSVNARTSYGTGVVTITSSAYDEVSNRLGGSGNAAGGTTSTTYTYSGSIYYTYQVHSAPESGITVNIYLYLY